MLRPLWPKGSTFEELGGVGSLIFAVVPSLEPLFLARNSSELFPSYKLLVRQYSMPLSGGVKLIKERQI